jgi:hypothetical protein
MSAFYLPGMVGDPRAVEDAYGEMRRQIEHDLGRPPTPRRISSLWTRRGSVDCVTEVGEQDPLHGGVVLAIFDMGHHQPFVVWRASEGAGQESGPETLGCSAYAVSEFDL